jgi:DNA-binding CsgD family transcriptional regulator
MPARRNREKKRAARWSYAQVQMVTRLAAARAPIIDIARALGVSPNTVKRNFRHILGNRTPGPAPMEFTKQQRDFVEAMAGFSIPQEDIARVIGIAVDTLRAHFRDELDLGPIRMNLRVVTNLFTQTKTNPAAAIYWTKARLGWRERVHLDLSHSGQVAVDHSLTTRDAVRRLSPSGRAALREVLSDLGASSAVAE